MDLAVVAVEAVVEEAVGEAEEAMVTPGDSATEVVEVAALEVAIMVDHLASPVALVPLDAPTEVPPRPSNPLPQQFIYPSSCVCYTRITLYTIVTCGFAKLLNIHKMS